MVEDALAWLPLVAGALPRAPRPAGEKEETGGKKNNKKNLMGVCNGSWAFTIIMKQVLPSRK